MEQKFQIGDYIRWRNAWGHGWGVVIAVDVVLAIAAEESVVHAKPEDCKLEWRKP